LSKGYLLDTSAIFTLTDNEEGADRVEDYLDRGKKGQFPVHISAMSAMELYYVTCSERSEAEANRLLFLARALPVKELALENALVLPAARIKSRHKVSVADAWIAATAMVHDLTVIHKDPEFERLHGTVSLVSLPYKPKKVR
jgi:predicted nucleic acid-binding protein